MDTNKSGACCSSTGCPIGSKPSDFKSCATSACDVLSKMYPSGLFKFNATSTKDTMTFFVKSSSKLESADVDASFETVWKQSNYSISTKVGSNSCMTLKSVCEPRKLAGSKFEFIMDYSPLTRKLHPTLVSTYCNKYTTSMLKVSGSSAASDCCASGTSAKCCLMEGVKNLSMEYSTVFKWNNLFMGVNLSSLAMNNLKDVVCLKAGYSTPDLELVAVHDKRDITLSLYKKATPRLELAAQAKYLQDSLKSILTLGYSYKLNNETTCAVKADTGLNIGLALKQKINDNISITVCTTMNGTCFAQCSKSDACSSGRTLGFGIDVQSSY